MIGDELGADMHVVSSDSAAARNLMLAIERCHLDVEAMVATPYAAGLSALVDDEAEIGTALVDLGGGTTTIGVFAGGRLTHIDAVAVGGNHVTMDIARGLTIRLSDAERLKNLYGSCISSPSDERETISVAQVGEDGDHPIHMPKSHLVRIIRPRVEEILELVRDRLQAAGFGPEAGRRLVLTGGAAQLTGIPEAARRIVSNQVRVGRPLGIQGLPESAKSPAFSAAVGLLVYPQVAGIEHFEPRRKAMMQSTGTDGYMSPHGTMAPRKFLGVRVIRRGAAAKPKNRRTEFRYAGRRRALFQSRGQTMTINLKAPELRELKPRIMVAGVGGAGGNAVNNMIVSGLVGVDFIVANTDAQALTASKADRIIQMGLQVTEGLGAGSQPEVGRAAAEEALEEIRDHLAGAHMVFVTAGMGGGTGTGAAPVIARMARDMGILTVGVVTKPFQFEGVRRMRVAESGINELQKAVDTLIVIPNQNLFRVANERTTFADAFAMADQVLYSGVACITDLMVKEGLINLDFADVRAIMREMGKAMMGTGEASGERRAILAAEAAIANPLLDEVSMKGARGLLISITGGNDLTLYEVDEAASRIRQEVDEDANIILGATFDQTLDGVVRVSVVATGIDQPADIREFSATETRIAEVAQKLREQTQARAAEQVRYQAPVGEVAPYQAEAAAPVAAPIAAAPVPAAPAAPVAAAPQAPLHAPAPAAPVMQHDVQIQPLAPKPVYTPPPVQEAPRAPEYQQPAQHFIPPAAEAPVMRAPRMPQIEDLPRPGQEQLRQRESSHVEPAGDTRRRTLLERLASFGMSRQEETPAPRAAAPQPPMPAPGHSYAPRAPQAPAPVHQEYGKRPVVAPGPRPAQGQLDAHGRTSPQGRSAEDEQLEIPAFLRRQSS